MEASSAPAIVKLDISTALIAALTLTAYLRLGRLAKRFDRSLLLKLIVEG